MTTKTIEIFPWSANFQTGIDEIDEQHKVLVKLINRLALHLSDESQSELLDETFNELADYAVYHFQCEERIWERFFPKESPIKGHKETHSNFISTLTALKKEEETVELYQVTEHLLSFLVNWLAQHILDSDMRMAKTVIAMQSGLSLEASQDKVDKEMSGVLGVILDTTLSMYNHLCERTLDLTREINKGKSAENVLRRFSRIFDATHEGIIITNPESLIVEVNPAFSKVTGYSRKEAIGKNPNFLGSGKQNATFYNEMWSAVKSNGHWQGEIWNRKKNGELFAELLTISVVNNEQGELLNYVGLFSDITQSKQQQESLELMAHYDVLTQLPNRALFSDRFVQAVGHSKRSELLLAVCFLDLDDFKPINDTYGHHVGDQLLIEVAERIKANIREEDTVSRQGGDEFTLLLGEIDTVQQCEILAKRILHSLAQPYKIEGQTFTISATLGATIYPLDDSDIDTLMRHADQAMYQAKLEGKGRHLFFNAEQDQQILKKSLQRDEIEVALSNNEFYLHYQPKVNMKTGKVYGTEALIRWQHPQKGLIPPLEFLPVIEETNIEILIGEWVIQTALKQLSNWKQMGINLQVSVNIASHHLRSEGFLTKLESALSTYPNVSPSNLELEILESSVLGDINAVNRIVSNCENALGIHFSLDDFGTGYSSLTHLRNLPAKTLKMDQSFVRKILDDPSDFSIIDGIIALSDSFNRKVIAEGVETTEHGLMLILMGCNQAQGYGIARPMPADQISEWLSNYSPNKAWLAYGERQYSIKNKRIELFRLASQCWLKRFDGAIQIPKEGVPHWPIMDKTSCPCGAWIKRKKEKELFDAVWLEQLETAHKDAHAKASTIKDLYLEGEIKTARAELPNLQELFSTIFYILNSEMDS